MQSEKIIVGPMPAGLKTDVTPFNIDNANFPRIINAFQWRGRVKRKRGTEFLGRLRRFFNSTSTSYSPTATFNLVAGAGNILTGFNLQINGNIVPGSVTITDTTSGNVYTDPAMDGVLVGAPGGSGTINYATGDITIVAGAANAISASFLYYPDLPVLGIEDTKNATSAFPGTTLFDSKYAYNIETVDPYRIYDVSFYKNLATATYTNYVQKTTWTPTSWNGQDYQQFWSTNYEGALWVTNGINVPFSTTNIGMQFKPIVAVTVLTATTATLQITAHGLVIGDFVFVNEVVTTKGINFQTGYVTTVTDANNVIVTFPNATLATNGTGGIAQYLTSRADITKDCIRWYDGDPTNGNPLTPGFSTGKGWVNFMPPLSFEPFSIAQTPAKQYYLAGARMIVPFKDRLLFVGPVIQSSAGNDQIYLNDTVIYSQNGTPYYTASFASTDDAQVSLPNTTFFPILVPVNRTAQPTAFFEDQTGFGGFVSSGIDKEAITTSANEDVLMIGFEPDIQTKLIYSGNDIIPFNFYLVNSEYGSSSTFSAINLDKGVITIGNRGIVISSQDQVARIDLDIPDQVFQFNLFNNGNERVTAQRDFINEWIYFTYLSNELSPNLPDVVKFPNQTLFYNYRDASWAIFNESYTHYGQFRKATGFTWATVGLTYKSWQTWTDPWDSGESTLLQPQVMGGNQQGFVLLKSKGIGEGTSLYIRSFASSVVTSPDHGLNQGDYIYITGVLGTIGAQVNGKIFSVTNPGQNTFTLNPTITAGTYLGGGEITRMYVPFIQTKQFPSAWGDGRKTRIGVQRYLLTTTASSQITLYIYLSQNMNSPYNFGPVIPELSPDNSSLIYSTVLYTCPESTNLGLTPANINLQTPTAIQQAQIWHRLNTSLIGDTVQLGFTMSDAQMRLLTEEGGFTNQFSEIELHGFNLDIYPSQMLV